MDLEELKAWANMLDVELRPWDHSTGVGKWLVRKCGWDEYVYEDQPAEHWLSAIKSVAKICSVQD